MQKRRIILSRLQLIEHIASTSSKNAKIDLLSEYMQDDVFAELLQRTYNPYYTYYTKKVDIPKEYGDEDISIIFDVLDQLYQRKVTGHAAQTLIVDTMKRLSPDDQEVFKRVILQNLKAGFSESSINKARVGFIDTYPCLLAKNYTEKYASKIAPPYYTQMKYDGARINVLYKDGVITYRTRSGKTYNMNVPHIDVEVHQFASVVGENFVLDGEVIVLDESGLVERSKSNGIVNKAVKGTISDSEAKNFKIFVWDYVPYDDFVNKSSDMTYDQRFEKLEFFDSEMKMSDAIERTLNYVYYDITEALDKCSEFINDGFEGGMIKPFDLLWEDKRSTKLLKVKGVADCELRVVGWEYGDKNSAFSDGIGSLVCETDDGLVTVRVSSGLSMAERGYVKDANDNWVIDPSFDFDQYNGKVVTVNYATITQNKQGNYSLFTAKLIEFREDKNETDSLDSILG